MMPFCRVEFPLAGAVDTALETRWTPPPQYCDLAPAELHLWRCDLDECKESGEGWEMLAVEERERAQRFRFERDKKRFVAARIWLRTTLAGYLKTTPMDLDFHYGVNGKPRLASTSDAGERCQFNLTHCGAMAVLVVACGRAVGIDIEARRPVADLEAIAERLFTPHERTRLMRATASDARSEVFLELWTRKEALAKAEGVGLDDTFKEMDGAESGGGAWQLGSFEPAPGYVGALAAAATPILTGLNVV